MGRYRIDRRHEPARLPWHERVLVLWTKDDATRGQSWELDGHEDGPRAFERIFRSRITNKKKIDTVDFGDAGMDLFENGMVYGWSCEGDFVGVVVEEIPGHDKAHP